MKILITGGTGLLGNALIQADDINCEIVATYFGNYDMKDTNHVKYKRLDIRNEDGYKHLFNEFRPKIVIHTASVSSPDYAEKNKKVTWEIDVGGIQNIINNCKRYGSKFIYISSNGIFDGNNAPYSENDKTEPINYYGQLKLEGEKLTKKSKTAYAIVRPMLMYGWNLPFERSNIITFTLKKLKKGNVVNLYEDVFCNPISAEFCAEAIWRMIQSDIYEVFNLGGRDIINIYQFGKIAAEVFGLNTNLIRPVRQEFFKDLVKRPKNTYYKTTKMENILGIEPLPVRKGLKIMKAKAGKDYV